MVDATVMRKAALRAFLEKQIAQAKAEGVLFSLHMKATMMKVSDPIIFGHAVKRVLPGADTPSTATPSRSRSALERRLGSSPRRASTSSPDKKADRRRRAAGPPKAAPRSPW